MDLVDILRRALQDAESSQWLSDKIKKGSQGTVAGPLDYNGQKIALKVFDYTDRPDVAKIIKDFEREYQSLKALSHPSIVRFVAFDHIPNTHRAYLRMQWASTELSDSGPDGAVDLGDIICYHDGMHGYGKSFLPESFIWHVLFHLGAALSLCHHGVEIQRKKIAEKSDSRTVLNRLTKTPPCDLLDLALQHPEITWITERITFSIKDSHNAIIHRDIKPRNVLLCDPTWNDHDENWRKSVSLREPDMFCVYPLILLGDFGLSAPLRVAQTRGIGSYGFTAPEVPVGPCRPDSPPFAWTRSCDIFSLGATIWNLMSLKTPPESLANSDQLEEIPAIYSPNLRTLVLKCFAVDASVRPTAIDILDECIHRGYWNETFVSPYGTLVSPNFHTALQQSWRDCVEQLKLPRQSTTSIHDAPYLLDDTLSLMKLGQQEKYGRFSIFIAGAYFLRNFVCNPHFLVPLQRTTRFVGRQRVLRLLHSRINSSTGGQVVMSLLGMGGIGKTQIAIQFAHQVREADPEISVFWVNGASLSALEESYHRIAVECNIVSSDRLDSLFMSRVKHWLESERAGRWLMIIDNVDDEVKFLETEDNQCLPPSEYVPKCTHGSILYTTRNFGLAKQVSVSENIVHVSEFTEAEANTLFGEMISATKPDSQLLATLSEELGCHPLAISQAAAFMNSYELSISEYLGYLKDQQSAPRLLKFETTDSTRDKGWESLYSTWKISFDHLQRRNPLAADVLALMSFLHPDKIPVSLLAQAFTDKLSLSEAVALLRAMSLISPYSEGNAYAIHRLIQTATVEWLESQGSRPRFLSMAMRLLARAFPEDQYDNWEFCSVLLPHAMEILSLRAVPENDLLVRAELLEKVSQYELKLGRLQDTENLAREAFRITSSVRGRAARDTSRCQVHLARVLLALGKYLEAEKLACEAFRNLQDQDPTSSDTINAMGLTGLIMQNLGRYSEAVEIHKTELELRARTSESNSVEALSSRANLALVLDNLGKYEEAESHFRIVLDGMERLRGGEHPDTITAMANLAITLRHRGQLDGAAKMFKEVLEKTKRILGEEHPSTISAMNNLANMLGDQGQLDEAAKMFKEVLEKTKRILGEEHPDMISAMNNLANTLGDQGQLDEAAKMKKEVLEKRKRILGGEHPSTISAMNNLAITLGDQGQLDEAAKMFKEVLEKTKHILGEEHPSTISTMNNLAITLGNQGQLNEAAKMFKEVLEKTKRILGEEHPSTISAMNNLAITLGDRGQLDEATKMKKEVLEKTKRILGKEHPSTILAMNNLANTLGDQGQLDEAAKMKEVRKMSKYGLSTLYTAEKPVVDIVFVHGLRGHREKTWMKDGSFWPKDFLATDLDDSRIMSFGYDSNIVHSDTAEVTQGCLEGDARSLCALLNAERGTPDSRNRPIIFVAHSLGGLVCAEVIILGERNATGDSVQTIAEYVNGIVFLGTPFAGSNLAKWSDTVRAIFNVVRKTNQTTLKTLKENSHDLKELGAEFPETIRKRNNTAKKVGIVFLYETLPTYGVMVVEEKSASYPGIGETIPIRCNHLNICKFASNSDDGYKVVKAKIVEIVRGQKEDDYKGSGDAVFHNYSKVINQAGRDMNIGSQSFQF